MQPRRAACPLPAHLVVDLDARVKAQQPRDHELCAVADRIHRAVLHHHALEVLQQDLRAAQSGRKGGGVVAGRSHQPDAQSQTGTESGRVTGYVQ